jgi:hypothetical protein
MRLLSLLVLVTVACASPRRVEFVNAPAVTAVDDRKHTPAAPKPRDYVRTVYHLEGNFVRRMTRALEVPRDRRALGVNALDEVPDSTWFTNRIGVRALTPMEIERGAGTLGTPEAHLPWTVRSTKVGGRTLGFVIEDARGEKFVLKFDTHGLPEMETGADAVVSRILWAAGYNVPEDHVVYFHARDLVLAPDAKIKDGFGNTRPLRRADLEKMIENVEREPDGRMRGLASHFLRGTPLGGHAAEGVRSDDPNDRIPHELRRDLRGSYAIFSWLDHVDIKEDNFLDMWVADPENPSHRYVKHYLVDFGSALGTMARKGRDLSRGYTYFFDVANVAATFVTLGMRERPWIGRESTASRGLGLYEVASFNPGAWKPYSAVYTPYHTADRIDQLWGSKILMRFTRDQLRAAVAAARFSDPRSAEELVDRLVARQRKTAAYWFARTAPLDNFQLHAVGDNYTLCFDDLSLTYQLSRSPTRYTVSTANRDGEALDAPFGLRANQNGRTCTTALALADYTTIEIRTQRAAFDGSTTIHIGRNADGSPRVIGVWRQ